MRTGARVDGLLVCAGALAAGLFAHFAASENAAAAIPAAAPAPNFLIVLSDDQAQNSFKPAYMPHTFADIADQGTRFLSGVAAPPLCCPDRAGILTGQYPHNHGVFSNVGAYKDLRDKRDTLPVWLRGAGYRTGFIGKFLNKYSNVAGAKPAPGFDRWFSYIGTPSYYNYTVSDDGTPRS